MPDARPIEIHCPACGTDSLLVREPKYEGFTRVGERLACASCGHEFASESDIPFAARETVQVFDDSDRGREVRVFDESEGGRLCRYCRHYVVNPFMQWCGHHRKEVEATDSCSAFSKKPDPKPPI